ncbi:hypothetical protein [Orbus mooreae]|uniref:hypothetical protein n=1 Tax=Orbus mooreae TaxID=3074107 RepID=UPI00370D42E2
MTDSAFVDELKLWVRFNRKHSEQMNDGLSYAVFGAPNMPKFIARLIISAFLNVKNQNKQDVKKIQSASHFMLLSTQEDTLTQWINLGRSMQRLLLNCTALGISYAYMNQPIEVESLSAEMKATLGMNQYPIMLLRLGFANPQPYSKRKPITELIIRS